MAGFRQSVEAAVPALRRYARALTHDAELADDLVQDTLERALTKFHLWQPGSNLRAWLFTIMHNVFINQMRSQAANMTTGLDDEDVPLTARPTQNDWLEVRDLQSALMRLPKEQRELLLLVGLEQMTYVEASDVLGIPMGTVMSRLSRAREHLRALLTDGGAHGALKVVK